MLTAEQRQEELRKKELGIDADALLRLEDKKFADAIVPEFGISNRKVIFLKLISYYIESNAKFLNDAERRFIQEMLKVIRGDMEFNLELKQLATISLRDTGINGALIGNIIGYIYKTRHYQRFPNIFAKINRNYNRIINGMELAEEHRITLSEYANVNGIAKLSELLRIFKNIGFLTGDEELEQFNDQVQRSLAIIKKMEEDYVGSYEIKPGTIVFDNTHKKSSVLGKCLSFFESLIAKLITMHGHASKIYTQKHQQRERVNISHINPAPIDERFSMRDYLYADIYRINVEALISEEKKAYLKQAFGNDWKETIEAMFGDIEREIHDGTVERFSGLSASAETGQYKAGLATLVPFGLGHKQFSSNDFSEIHRKVFSDFYRQGRHNLLCSEFVAYTTIAALVELDKRLLAMLREKNIHVKEGIITMPIGRHENLSVMHPDRLLHVLKKAGCLEQENMPSKIGRYFSRVLSGRDNRSIKPGGS